MTILASLTEFINNLSSGLQRLASRKRAQEPFANPDFPSWKQAICKQLHALISKIETYLDHRYKCTIAEEHCIRYCINLQIDNLGRVDDYYELPLTSGPESDDPQVVEEKKSGARVTCGWIQRIVTQEGIEFVPGAKSREIYQLAIERGKSVFQRFSMNSVQRIYLPCHYFS
jgi:hypothetical protein